MGLRAPRTLMSPATPSVPPGPQHPHPHTCSGVPTPDPGPGVPTFGPTGPSLEHASPPWASLGPEQSDTLCQGPADKGDGGVASGTPQDANELDSQPLLRVAGAASALVLPREGQQEEGGMAGEEECPICTEPYGAGERHLELLNCGHSLCVGCLHHLLDLGPSTDAGRVRCPLCRQKTPILEWEICRLQEELLQADGPPRLPPPTPPALPHRGPGLWAALEHRYQLRFLAGTVGGRSCLPFLPCPPCLGTRLWVFRERGPCARRLALLGLLGLELLGLLLGFTPLLLLGLLFALLDRSSH
ncbi:ring finger protein-like [Tamandua tetradactyla]|uniref:ring finger protein-like n=1 Tax=Tamandua tetradactyla TaxID=48850 RepID=UPI0040539BD1